MKLHISLEIDTSNTDDHAKVEDLLETIKLVQELVDDIDEVRNLVNEIADLKLSRDCDTE